MSKQKKIISITIPVIIILIYLLGALYYRNHFFIGTKINNIKVSNMKIDEAEDNVEELASSFVLNIKGREDYKTEICGSAIQLKYDLKNEVENIKKQQSPFLWVISFLKNKSYNVSKCISYNEESLNQIVNNLGCLSDYTEPEDAKLEYEDGKYVIVDEVLGNKVNQDKLQEKVKECILSGKESIDLDKSECYINPKYYKDSQEVKDACDKLNTYLKSKVTYKFGNNTETIDKSLIKDWLIVDENMNVTLSEYNVTQYVYTLASKYNTTGVTKDFKKNDGSIIQISGGDYGYSINTAGQVKDIIDAVSAGDNSTREPVFGQKGNSFNKNDIGTTYVEIDLARQHIWVYQNSALAVEGDIVTGNVSTNCATPPGIYKIDSKSRNFTLTGKDDLTGQTYNTPVAYWMPFNGGIGLHDADWRYGQFGGQIYLTNGSHGCVNLPPDLASRIYDIVSVGTAVVLY